MVWALGDDKELIEWARKTGTLTYYDYHHADLSLYKNAEIELHNRPSLSRNLLRNARLQQWFNMESKLDIRKRLKQLCWLLKYTQNPKVRMVSRVYNIFGYAITERVLRLYNWYRSRN